jgi:hypothetical protein
METSERVLERLRIADEQKRRENPYSDIHRIAIDEIEHLRALVLDLEAQIEEANIYPEPG